MAKKKPASGKTALEKIAHEYRLQQARELLADAGYAQGPGDTWTSSAMGKRGGEARAKNLTKEQLAEIGRKGAQKRWAKKSKKGGRS